MNEKIPILKIEKISKSFGKKVIFENISFDLYKSEIFGLVGLSGCGKTTLLNVLCGFVIQDNGQILYHEEKSNKYKVLLLDENKLKTFIGFSSQNPSFYLELSVFENLKFFGTLNGINEEQIILRADKILNMLRLKDSKEIRAIDLSEGMKKRLDIAIALINEPQILILDEPTSNLDVVLREELYKYIQEVNREGVCIIFVSHYIEEIKHLCDRVAIMHDKTITLVEDKAHIIKKYKTIVYNEIEAEIKNEVEKNE